MAQEAVGATIQGRIVWLVGNTPFEGELKTDMQTKQVKLNQNGEQMRNYGFGLAVPKEELHPGKSAADFWAKIQTAAQQLYPQGVPPGFAWKYKDGDGVDHNGQPFANRAGHKGCLIFGLTTSLPIQFFKFENNQYVMVKEGIKCGDYVQVNVSIKAHPAMGAGKAGLYLNPQAVLFLAYGEEIQNRPSAQALFGATPPQFAMPPGASLQPTVPAQGVLGAPVAAQPNYGVIPQNLQPTAPPPQLTQMPMPAQQPLAQHYPQQQPTAAPVPAGVPGWPQQ